MTNQDFDQMVFFFDQMAQTSWLSKIHQQMVGHLGQQEKLHVIDVGCATGRFLQRISDQLERGVGIDLSPEMIKEANRIVLANNLAERLEFYEGDAYDLPVEQGGFDVAISTCVIFLLPEPEKGLAEISRVLKAGGCLLMLNPAPNMNPESALAFARKSQIPEEEWEYLLKWSNVSTRRHRYSNQEIEQQLRQYHFTDIEIIEVLDGLAHITRAIKKS